MTAVGRFSRLPVGAAHLDALIGPLEALYDETDRIGRWGERLAAVLGAGGRLLALGNGGSACQAQHLTSELVGRYRDDRPAFSALALCTETSALTAIGNDYGIEHLFARQVQGHGRPGDLLVALSTSGRSPNVLAAVEAARGAGLYVLALTGRPGNPLARAADDAVCVDSPHTATVQEVHQVALHLLCAAFEEALPCPG
jgi:D-sedoheptulose 7-phosphate isomerase